MTATATVPSGDMNTDMNPYGDCTAKTIEHTSSGLVCRVNVLYSSSAQVSDAVGKLDMCLVVVLAALVYFLRRRRDRERGLVECG